MSRKIGFLQRWMFIIDKINAHPYITKEELQRALENEFPTYDGADDVGVKSRTLHRDLAEIRNSPYMDISIEFCRKRMGYYIPQDEKSLSKLDRMFELSSLLSFSSLKDIVFVENRVSRGLEHRFSLISAIRKGVEVVVDYRKYQTGSIRERRLRPYALREVKNRWYLLATEENNKEIKIWGLDRIEKLTLTSCKFEKDPTMDLEADFEYCYGIYASKDLPVDKVVLSFAPLNGKYIKSCPLHKTQRVLIDNEHELRVELFIKVTRDFITELLSHSEGMKVIAPGHLRENLIGIHRKALEQLEFHENNLFS